MRFQKRSTRSKRRRLGSWQPELLEARRVMTSVVDLNGDGHQDVLTNIAWYAGDGHGAFVVHDLLEFTGGVIGTADFDGDGDLDLLAKETRWLENRQGDFSLEHRLQDAFTVGSFNVQALDIDGDGDQDILDGRLDATYPNGVQTFSTVVRLWANQGNGTFAAPAPIALAVLPARNALADWDHNGLINSVTLQQGPLKQDGERYYFEFDVVSNEYGSAEAKTLKTFEVVVDPVYPGPFISEYSTNPDDVRWADINGDGESDLVVRWSTGINWQMNEVWYSGNGQGQFDGGHPMLSYSTFGSNIYPTLMDTDADGDLDVLVREVDFTAVPPAARSWLLTNTGQGFEKLGSESQDFIDVMGQLNADSVFDRISGGIVPSWADGTSGTARPLGVLTKSMKIFWMQQAMRNRASSFDSVYGVNLDLNGDGFVWLEDFDMLLKSLSVPKADANLDGAFDSSDLVRVFQAGEYSDNLYYNSRWETGDWNGDFEFDSSDLIFAFQAGGYAG